MRPMKCNPPMYPQPLPYSFPFPPHSPPFCPIVPHFSSSHRPVYPVPCPSRTETSGSGNFWALISIEFKGWQAAIGIGILRGVRNNSLLRCADLSIIVVVVFGVSLQIRLIKCVLWCAAALPIELQGLLSIGPLQFRRLVLLCANVNIPSIYCGDAPFPSTGPLANRNMRHGLAHCRLRGGWGGNALFLYCSPTPPSGGIPKLLPKRGAFGLRRALAL